MPTILRFQVITNFCGPQDAFMFMCVPPSWRKDSQCIIERHGLCNKGSASDVAGVVVNERLNVPREDFDRLKATLTNCIRFGPQSQNRGGLDDFRHHLNGRVSFVESLNPAKGQRLRCLYDRIEW